MQRFNLFVSGTWCLALGAFPLAGAGWIPFGMALFVVSLGALAAAGATIWAGRRFQETSLRAPLLAAALLPLLVLGFGTWGILSFPWVKDVATTDRTPPRFLVLSAPADAVPTIPKNISSVHSSAKPEVLLGRALVAARSLPGWELRSFDLKAGHLEGTARSPVLGIPSQIAVQVRPDNRRAVLDVRARSPIATGDFGSNARLIQLFMKRLGEAAICRPPAAFLQKPASKS